MTKPKSIKCHVCGNKVVNAWVSRHMKQHEDDAQMKAKIAQQNLDYQLKQASETPQVQANAVDDQREFYKQQQRERLMHRGELNHAISQLISAIATCIREVATNAD